jgi:hypothetical protein
LLDSFVCYSINTDRYHNLDSVFAAADAGDITAFCGAATQALLGPSAAAGTSIPGSAGEMGARGAARRNLSLLRLAAEQQRVPQAVEAAVHSALLGSHGGGRTTEDGAAAAKAAPSAAAAGHAAGSQSFEAAGGEGLARLVALHPVVGGHWARYAPQAAAASAALRRLGLPHAVRWVCCEGGLPLDLVVRVFDGGSGRLLPGLRRAEDRGGRGDGSSGDISISSGDGDGGGGGGGSESGSSSGSEGGSGSSRSRASDPVEAERDVHAQDRMARSPLFPQRDCVAIQLVGPDDAAPSTGASALPLWQPKQRQLSGTAKRRRALLKDCGWRVVLLAVQGTTAARAARGEALATGMGLSAGVHGSTECGGGDGSSTAGSLEGLLRAVLREAVGFAGAD